MEKQNEKVLDNTLDGELPSCEMNVKEKAELSAKLSEAVTGLQACLTIINGNSNPAKVDLSAYGAKGKLVLAAVQDCGSVFTIRDVVEQLRKKNTPMKHQQVANALFRLCGVKIQELIKRSGNRPAVYGKNLPGTRRMRPGKSDSSNG